MLLGPWLCGELLSSPEPSSDRPEPGRDLDKEGVHLC